MCGRLDLRLGQCADGWAGGQVRGHLGAARGGVALGRAPGGGGAPARPNMGLWQLTGSLPLRLDLVFLGGASEAGGDRVPLLP